MVNSPYYYFLTAYAFCRFLHDGDVCNLGSINLDQFVDESGDIMWHELRETTHTAVEMLDNVIDITWFTSQRVNAMFKGNRRVGLGIMGFADMLLRMRIPYDSERGRDVAARVMNYIDDAAQAQSKALGLRKGPFPNIGKSIYKDNRRNGAVTNVAPTGSISMIYDVSGGVRSRPRCCHTARECT